MKWAKQTLLTIGIGNDTKLTFSVITMKIAEMSAEINSLAVEIKNSFLLKITLL